MVVAICRCIKRKYAGILFCTNCLPGKDKLLEINSLDGEFDEFGLLVMTRGGEYPGGATNSHYS